MTYEERLKRFNFIKKSQKDKKILTRIAKDLGISKQRLYQILNAGKPKKIQKDKKSVYVSKQVKINTFFYITERDKNILNQLSGKDRTREIVRIRDNRTCQDCGKKWEEGTRRFDVHHLNGLCGKKSQSYDKISEIGGLITLCHKCHFNRPEHATKKGC